MVMAWPIRPSTIRRSPRACPRAKRSSSSAATRADSRPGPGSSVVDELQRGRSRVRGCVITPAARLALPDTRTASPWMAGFAELLADELGDLLRLFRVNPVEADPLPHRPAGCRLELPQSNTLARGRGGPPWTRGDPSPSRAKSSAWSVISSLPSSARPWLPEVVARRHLAAHLVERVDQLLLVDHSPSNDESAISPRAPAAPYLRPDDALAPASPTDCRCGGIGVGLAAGTTVIVRRTCAVAPVSGSLATRVMTFARGQADLHAEGAIGVGGRARVLAQPLGGDRRVRLGDAADRVVIPARPRHRPGSVIRRSGCRRRSPARPPRRPPTPPRDGRSPRPRARAHHERATLACVIDRRRDGIEAARPASSRYRSIRYSGSSPR